MKTQDKGRIGRLALIGVGLIGGSMARALRRAGLVDEIIGCARTEATLERAKSLGVIDLGSTDVQQAAAGADMVVVAVPVLSSAGVFAAMAPALSSNAVITDVGSVKGQVVEAAIENLGEHARRFVPGHPIAGTENSGVAASFAELFENKNVVLTPIPTVTDIAAIQRVSDMWVAVGADVLQMDVSEHDNLLAMTSHLPHVLAYALVGYLAGHPRADSLFQLAAAGFYDFTRIASSDPVMWRDISVSNKAAIATALSGFRDHIDTLLSAIEAADGERLLDAYQRAKNARDLGVAGKKPTQ